MVSPSMRVSTWYRRPSAAARTCVALVVLICCQQASGARWQHNHPLFGGPAAPAAGNGRGCTPQEVLLSLGGEGSSMHVSWRTAAPDCPSEILFERLSEAAAANADALPPLTDTSPGVLNSVGYSYVLSERDMCTAPATSHTFTWNLHRATLKQLVPSARYRYRVQGGSQHWAFRAVPRGDEPFTFIGFGDMGDAVHPQAKSPGAASTLLRLQSEVDARHRPAQLILHVGDISYANGDPEIWGSFLAGLPFAARVPYMVATGNHEYGYDASPGSSKVFTDPSGAKAPYQPSWGNFGPDSRGECGAVLARRFHMPRSRRGDSPPFWFSYEYGGVHFTTISTEHDLGLGSPQYEWLRDDLESVDRCATPWLVLLLHRPMYVIYPHKSNREVGDHLRDELEPLLLRHRVDLTLSGHVHSYYRTCAVNEEECVDGGGADSNNNINHAHGTAAPAATTTSSSVGSSAVQAAASSPSKRTNNRPDSEHGIVHFVIGSAGRKLSDVDRGQEEWCAASVQVWGFGRFTVRDSTHLLAEYVASETGEVLDSVEVVASDARREMCTHGSSSLAGGTAATA